MAVLRILVGPPTLLAVAISLAGCGGGVQQMSNEEACSELNNHVELLGALVGPPANEAELKTTEAEIADLAERAPKELKEAIGQMREAWRASLDDDEDDPFKAFGMLADATERVGRWAEKNCPESLGGAE